MGESWARCAFVAVALYCVATPESLAQRSLEAPPTERYLQWGPMWARPVIRVFDVGWDSNVFNAPVSEGDFTATVAPAVDGMFLFGDSAFLTLDAELRYTAYQNFTDLNYVDWFSRTSLTIPVGRFGFFGGLRYDRVRRTPPDLDVTRLVERLAEGEAGLIFEISPRTAIQYTRRHSDFENGGDELGSLLVDGLARIQNRVESADIIELDYEAFSRTRFSFYGETNGVEFETPSILGLPELSRDSRFWQLRPGVSLGDYGSLLGQMQIGWARLDYDGEALLDYDGLVGEANVTWRPFGRTTLEWEAWRRVGFAISALNNYFVDKNTGVNAVHFFNSTLGIDAAVALRRVEIPATNRVDDLVEYSVGVRIRTFENSMGRRVEYGVEARRFERNSTNDLLDRDRNALQASIHIGY